MEQWTDEGNEDMDKGRRDTHTPANYVLQHASSGGGEQSLQLRRSM
jgi:hypothetical protein